MWVIWCVCQEIIISWVELIDTECSRCGKLSSHHSFCVGRSILGEIYTLYQSILRGNIAIVIHFICLSYSFPGVFVVLVWFSMFIFWDTTGKSIQGIGETRNFVLEVKTPEQMLVFRFLNCCVEEPNSSLCCPRKYWIRKGLYYKVIGWIF